MFKRKKGFTAAGTKLTSYRMRSATVGTHVPRRERVRRGDMNADAVGFSSSRKKRRAARGYVDHVTPSSSSGENGRDYSRRVSHRQFAEQMQRKERAHRISIVVVVCIVVLCVAIGVGTATFVGSVNGKLALGESNAADALVAETADAPYYTLVIADLSQTEGASSQMTAANTAAYVLVRADMATSTFTVVPVPSTLQVKLSDGNKHPLSDAQSLGGDAALIAAVESFAGVSVSHVVKTDTAGIAHLVEKVGGVSVTLAEEVDDPVAGNVYLPAGEQALDATSALTLLRASNYAGGVASQSANRAAFFSALVKRLAEPSGLALLSQLDATAADVQTDWTFFDALSLADALRGETTFYATSVPGKTTTADGVEVYVSSSTAWTTLMDHVRAGEDPAAVSTDTPAVDPASFTIAVRNGTDTTGSAALLTQMLAGQGYNVVETGNVDDYTTYPETLVIYRDSAYLSAAQALVSSMGAGRTVSGGAYYTFEANVLVIIGTDWQPIV